MDGASNEGLNQRRLARMRTNADVQATPGAYAAAGEVISVPGDADAPFAKVLPFPSEANSLLHFVFRADPVEGTNEVSLDTYVPAEVLEVGNVRTVTAWFTVTGDGDPGDLSVLNIIGAAVLPSRDGDEDTTLDMSRVFPITSFVTATTALTTALPPFDTTADFLMKNIAPVLYRGNSMAPGEVIRYTITWDVAPFTRFVLFLAATATGGEGDTIGCTVEVSYTYAN